MKRKTLRSNRCRANWLLASFLLTGQLTYAQTGSVNGVVKDASGETFPEEQ
jgi:hypothetical protein